MNTKSIKKLETTTDSFKEVGAEGATVTLIKMEAEEVLTSVEKLKEHQKDLESISSSLQNAINDCESNELKGFTPDDAMNKVENEVEEYLERIDIILKNKKRIIADAKEKSVLVMTTTVAPTLSSGQHCQQGDQFRDLSVHKPKYLERRQIYWR